MHDSGHAYKRYVVIKYDYNGGEFVYSWSFWNNVSSYICQLQQGLSVMLSHTIEVLSPRCCVPVPSAAPALVGAAEFKVPPMRALRGNSGVISIATRQISV